MALVPRPRPADAAAGAVGALPARRRHAQPSAATTTAVRPTKRSPPGALLRAGHTADTAWQQILAAHPDAMTKARASHRRWILHVWNRAVLDDTTFTPVASRNPEVLAASRRGPQPIVGAAAGPTIAGVDPARRSGDPRPHGTHRHLRVPVPERNLVLDTGITDRTTIRDSAAPAAGPRRRHPAHRHPRTRCPPGTDLVRVLRPGGRGPRNPPTWYSHPPSPSPLVRPATHRRTVLALPGNQPRGSQRGPVADRDRADTARRRAVPTSGGRRRRRAARTRTHRPGHLRRARHLARRPPPSQAIPATRRPSPKPSRTQRVRRERVETERAAYRSRVFSEWGRQRAAAIDKQRRRHQAWWDALGEHEQQRRRASAATGFARHSPHDQARRTHQWASRRRAAGASEAERHDAWISSIPDEDYQHRAAHRARVYAARPSHERWELAAAWAAHRREFNVGRGKQSPRRPDHGGPG